MSPALPTGNRVRDLNDAFRTAGPGPSGQWLVTRGIQELGPEFTLHAIRAVRSFDSFTVGDDPYGEHDFGSIDVGGEHVFWKIDYYDLSLRYGSDDPADETVTRRVLTVMLASEY